MENKIIPIIKGIKIFKARKMISKKRKNIINCPNTRIQSSKIRKNHNKFYIMEIKFSRISKKIKNKYKLIFLIKNKLKSNYSPMQIKINKS